MNDQNRRSALQVVADAARKIKAAARIMRAALSGGLKPQAVESPEGTAEPSALHEDSPEIRPVRWPSA